MLTPTGYPPPPTQQPTWPTAHTAHSPHCGHTALPPGQKRNPRRRADPTQTVYALGEGPCFVNERLCREAVKSRIRKRGPRPCAPKRVMMICLPPQGTPSPPNTAADMAHSTHSTQPALRPRRATPRAEDKPPRTRRPYSNDLCSRRRAVHCE